MIYLHLYDSSQLYDIINKNDNINKNEAQKSYDQKNIDKYKVTANIREYHIRIIITKFIMTRQLFRVKNVCKNIIIIMFKMDVT